MYLFEVEECVSLEVLQDVALNLEGLGVCVWGWGVSMTKLPTVKLHRDSEGFREDSVEVEDFCNVSNLG